MVASRCCTSVLRAIELLLRERDLGRCCSRLALASSSACCACLRPGLRPSSATPARSRVSIRATIWPALTMSPLSASISAMRPANFVSMSISSASIRPLPEAIPSGNCGRDCSHAIITAAADNRRERDEDGDPPPGPARRLDAAGRRNGRRLRRGARHEFARTGRRCRQVLRRRGARARRFRILVHFNSQKAHRTSWEPLGRRPIRSATGLFDSEEKRRRPDRRRRSCKSTLFLSSTRRRPLEDELQPGPGRLAPRARPKRQAAADCRSPAADRDPNRLGPPIPRAAANLRRRARVNPGDWARNVAPVRRASSSLAPRRASMRLVSPALQPSPPSFPTGSPRSRGGGVIPRTCRSLS